MSVPACEVIEHRALGYVLKLAHEPFVHVRHDQPRVCPTPEHEPNLGDVPAIFFTLAGVPSTTQGFKLEHKEVFETSDVHAFDFIGVGIDLVIRDRQSVDFFDVDVELDAVQVHLVFRQPLGRCDLFLFSQDSVIRERNHEIGIVACLGYRDRVFSRDRVKVDSYPAYEYDTRKLASQGLAGLKNLSE